MKNFSICNRNKSSREALQQRLDRLYELRDLEIKNLWQRSVFLSVFLTLSLTGYGWVATKLISPEATANMAALNTAAVAALCLCAILSVLWIMMAKGSKKWFEVSEQAIYEFEHEYRIKLRLPEKYIMGEMKLDARKRNDSIFSQQAGYYSPSRVNIMIGQVTLILAVLLILMHLIYSRAFLHTTDLLYGIVEIILPFLTLISCLFIVSAGRSRD